MILEQGKSYIQKNPLFGRKVIRFERIRESVWDWNLCDVTIVTIDKEPGIVQLKSAASSIYDHQELMEIPGKTFDKIHAMVKLLSTMLRVTDEQKAIVLRQETLGQIIELLTATGIIDEDTYSAEQIKIFTEEYDIYTRQQMEHVTHVIDVHK